MTIVVGSDILGPFIAALEEDTILIGKSTRKEMPKPFFLECSEAADIVCEDLKLEEKMPSSCTMKLSRKGILNLGGKVKYKRPGSFQRDSLSGKLCYKNPSIFKIKPPVKLINGNVVYINIERKKRNSFAAELCVDSEDGIKKIEFNGDLKIFITLPLETIAYKGDNKIALVPYRSSYDLKNIYHVYQVTFKIKNSLTRFDYIYIQDKFFKKPLLKRIVPEEEKIHMQFISRHKLFYSDLIKICSKAGSIFGEPSVESFKKIGVELKSSDSVFIRPYQKLLKEKFNTMLIGRFATQDHSRIGENLFKAWEFLQGR